MPKKPSEFLPDFHMAGLREAAIRRQAEWPGAGEVDLCFRGLEMAGEAGEAANVVKKLVRLDRNIRGTTEQRDALIEHLASELADVIITVDLIATAIGVDLTKAVIEKFNQTSLKHGLDTRMLYSGGYARLNPPEGN